MFETLEYLPYKKTAIIHLAKIFCLFVNLFVIADNIGLKVSAVLLPNFIVIIKLRTKHF